MPPRPTGTRRFATALVVVGLILVVVVVAVAIRHRSQSRLPQELQRRAATIGATLKFSGVSAAPWRATMRDVELTFAGAAGIRATADSADVRPGAGDWPEIASEHLQLAIDAGALMALEELSRSELMRGLPLTWRRLDIIYTNRLTGPVRLDDVTVPAASVVHAGRITVGARRWDDVTMALQRRGQMLEIALGSKTVAGAPLALAVFPPQGGANTFIATLAHPPAPVLARALGVGLGPGFDGARVGGSISVTVPDDVTRPVSARVELIVGGWPSPALPDAAVILGKTIGLGARAVVAPDRASLTLEPARLSTSLFTLAGSGRLLLGDGGRVLLDLAGSLTCAQIRGNLPPSEVQAQVSRYLDAAPAPKAPVKPGGGTVSRAAERTTMLVQVDAALAHTSDAHVAWKVDPGCGLTGFTLGTFTSPAVPTAPAGLRP